MILSTFTPKSPYFPVLSEGFKSDHFSPSKALHTVISGVLNRRWCSRVGGSVFEVLPLSSSIPHFPSENPFKAHQSPSSPLDLDSHDSEPSDEEISNATSGADLARDG